MNLDTLHHKLVAAARRDTPGDDVPYAFEKRIMARLTGRAAAADPLAYWAHALWRAAATCVVIMALCATWSILSPTQTETVGGADEELALALFSGVDSVE